MGLYSCALALIFAIDPEPTLPKPEEIKALVETCRKYWKVPGCSLVMVHQGKTVFMEGFGISNVQAKSPLTQDLLFPLASCTKGFTSTLAASLIAKNKIGWDSKAKELLPWFQLKDPLASEDCRLRDLFSHRCGLESHDLLWYRSKNSLESVVRKLSLIDTSYPFRSSFRYQSITFAAGGFCCEKAGGKPWEELIQEEIFSPLKMRNSYCKTPTVQSVSGHQFDQNGNAVLVSPYTFSTPDPANSIYTNTKDLAKWLEFQNSCYLPEKSKDAFCQQVKESQKGQVVLPMDAFHKRTHCFTTQMTYGMGWVIQDYHGLKLISHAGAIDGFRTHLVLIPEKNFALGIMANLEQTKMNLALSNLLIDRVFQFPSFDWNNELSSLLVEEQKALKTQWLELKDKTIAENNKSIPEMGIAGEYYHPAYGPANLEKSGNNYRFSLGELRIDLAPLGGSVLGGQDWIFGNPLVTVQLDKNGKVASLLVGGRINSVFAKKN